MEGEIFMRIAVVARTAGDFFDFCRQLNVTRLSKASYSAMLGGTEYFWSGTDGERLCGYKLDAFVVCKRASSMPEFQEVINSCHSRLY